MVGSSCLASGRAVSIIQIKLKGSITNRHEPTNYFFGPSVARSSSKRTLRRVRNRTYVLTHDLLARRFAVARVDGASIRFADALCRAERLRDPHEREEREGRRGDVGGKSGKLLGGGRVLHGSVKVTEPRQGCKPNRHENLATHHHRAGHRVLCAHTLGQFCSMRANLRLRHRVHRVHRPTVASLNQRAILKHLDFAGSELSELGKNGGGGLGGEHVYNMNPPDESCKRYF